MAEILVVDDERSVRNGLKALLSSGGYSVRLARSGPQALELFRTRRPDLVLLDVMMPGKGGFEVCREIRGEDPLVPVIFLTSLENEANQVRGFGLGADDYIPKTTGESELFARVRRAIERSSEFRRQSAMPRRAEIGRMTVDFDALTLRGPGVDERLTKTEADVLWLLNTERGRFFSTDEILEVVGGSDAAYDGAIRTHMSRLRRKFGAAAPMIVSLRGSGYKLLA